MSGATSGSAVLLQKEKIVMTGATTGSSILCESEGSDKKPLPVQTGSGPPDTKK